MTPICRFDSSNSRIAVGEHESPLADGVVTALIVKIEAGDKAARDELCELVYKKLLVIGKRMRQRSAGSSLATGEVVNEFLNDLLVSGRLGKMKNRRYLFKVAADQMHRLLIDRFREKRAKKRGGDRQREHLDPWLDELVDSASSRCGGDLEALDAALARLKHERPRQHEVVLGKFFVGLTNEQIAETLEVSIDTVKRDWKIARARLGASLGEGS
jgi:RNA polymerase sigma factor (TIGR02999 family)